MRVSRVRKCSTQHLMLCARKALTNIRRLKRMNGLYTNSELAARQAIVFYSLKTTCFLVSVLVIVPRSITATAEARS